MRQARLLSAALILLLAACSSESSSPSGGDTGTEDTASDTGMDDTGGDDTGTDDVGDDADPTDTGDDTDPTDTGDDVDPTDTGDDTGPTDTGDDTGPTDTGNDTPPMDTGTDSGSGGDLPCDVASVLEAHCWNCHGDVPRFGAPMSLTTVADFDGMTVDGEDTIEVRAQERINDERRLMPPPPNPEMPADDLAVLNQWLLDGTPEGDACMPGDDPPMDAGMDTTMDTGMDTTMDTGMDTGTPPECDQTVRFLAHNEQTPGDTTPYVVPRDTNHYECFYFDAPWGTDEVQALAFAPIIDDDRVLHHWLLYGTNDSGRADGDHRGCSGTHPDATLLAGWAPGGTDFVMPENVGLEMPTGEGAQLILEIHYYNAMRLDSTDRSGVEVCLADEPQPETAGMHWLGSEQILLLGSGERDVSGTCRPNLTEPAQIFNIWPHMHTHGRNMRVAVNRAGGGTDIILDEPFDFENQIAYDVPVTINPGDEIVTTCTFDNTSGGVVTFGPNTENEMCYAFTFAYPTGAFDTGGFVNNGPNFCLQ